MKDKIISNITNLWYPIGHLNDDQRNFLVDLLLEKKPKNCIETGFASGRSAVTVLYAAEPKKLISVDVNLDYIHGARQFSNKLANLFKNFQILEGSSSDVLNESFFEENFNDGIDFAFVDGDHTYSGALSDIQKIYKHMNSDAIMLVDDYYSCGPEGCEIVDVNNAVDDFCKNNNISVKKWHNKGKGFAIIRK